MKLNRLVPMLWTAGLDNTVKFCLDLLGFDCVNRMEGWAILGKDSIELMLSLPNAYEPLDKIPDTTHDFSAYRSRCASEYNRGQSNPEESWL